MRRLENTCDLREMWLVVYGYVIKLVMCVSVQCVETCCFVMNFFTRGHFYTTIEDVLLYTRVKSASNSKRLAGVGC